MADKILIKRNFTSGAVPTTASLDLGELAINVADGKLFLRRSGSVGDSISTFTSTFNSITTGSIEASVNVGSNLFLIKSASTNFVTVNNTGAVTLQNDSSTPLSINNTTNRSVFYVSQSGMMVLATSSINLTTAAPNGGIYFTSSSLFVGLD